MSLALFGAAQSASFECKFLNYDWGTIGIVYMCNVPNAVNITSLDAAQIDSISGTHLAGYNNDNVEAIDVYQQAQLNYFPRGLNNFFKNLKVINIFNSGLKEIHQSDLKDFPKLMNLFLPANNLEIIEENLFEFNPNLKWINLNSNKISHIDPTVFDNLTKLSRLYLGTNSCISMLAIDNSTVLQNVITTAQANCTNSDYSNLEQKVKYLEMESNDLDSDSLKKELDSLRNEIKNSKYPNFFQDKLQGLNATVIEKNSISKVNDVNDKLIVQNLKISGIEGKMTSISAAIDKINMNYESLNTRFINLINALENAFSISYQGSTFPPS